MRSDVVQAIGDLIRSGNAESTNMVTSVPGLKTDDIYPIFKKYFTSEAQQALETKTTSLIHQRNVLTINGGLAFLLNKIGLKSCSEFDKMDCYRREVDMVRYCARRATRTNIHKAVESVIVTINDLASRGYITATLMPLSVVALAPTDNFESHYVVISYIALTKASDQYVADNLSHMFVDEGAMPLSIEETK
jgi:hypothetical protein